MTGNYLLLQVIRGPWRDTIYTNPLKKIKQWTFDNNIFLPGSNQDNAGLLLHDISPITIQHPFPSGRKMGLVHQSQSWQTEKRFRFILKSSILVVLFLWNRLMWAQSALLAGESQRSDRCCITWLKGNDAIARCNCEMHHAAISWANRDWLMSKLTGLCIVFIPTVHALLGKS